MSSYKTLLRRYARHRKTLGYITPYKVYNLTKLLLDIKRRGRRVISKPIFARINPCSVCNLACPGCMIYEDKMGIKPYIRPKAMMSVDTFHRIIDSLRDTLLQVILYDEGEPLLNHNIWDMVTYAHKNRIRTVISTNLSFRMTDEQIDKVFSSGLDYLIIALDGMTQETYEMHRQGGNVDLVKRNFERIMNHKKSLGKQGKTEIEIQFLEFDHNIHEKQRVIDYAERYDADVINCFLPYSDELADTDSLEGKHRRHFGCFDLYAIGDFDVDGSLYSCDFQEDCGAEPIGNINVSDFMDIWNDDSMQRLRSSFGKSNEQHPLHNVCEKCPVTRGLPRVLR